MIAQAVSITIYRHASRFSEISSHQSHSNQENQKQSYSLITVNTHEKAPTLQKEVGRFFYLIYFAEAKYNRSTEHYSETLALETASAFCLASTAVTVAGAAGSSWTEALDVASGAAAA